MTSRAKAPLRSLTRRQAAATPAAACVSYLLSTAQGLAAHPALQQEPPRQHFSGPHGHKDLNCEQKPEGEEGPPPCSAEEKINLQEARATYSAVAAELCHRALMVSAKNSLPLPKGFVGTLCQACSLPLGPNTTESQSVSALSRTQARRQRRKLAASCAARQRSAGSSASTFKNPPIIPLMSSLQEIQFPLLAPVSLPTLFCSPRRNTCTLERVCLLCGHTNRLFFYTEDAAKKAAGVSLEVKRRSQAKEQQLSEAKGQEEGGGGTDTLTGGASILLDQPGLPVIEEAAAAQGEAGSMVDWLAKGQAGAGDQAYQRIDEETPADFEGNGPKGAQEDVNEGRVREGDEGEMRKEVMCEEKEVEMRKEDAQGKDEEQIILEAKIGDEGLGEEERMGQELQKEDTEAAEAEGPGRKGGMEDLLVEGKGIAADGHSAAFSLVSEDLGCSLGTVEQDNSGWGPSAPLSSAHTSGSPTQETPRSSLKPRGEDVGAFKRVQAAHAGNLEGAPDAQGCNKQLGGAEPENPTEVQEREEAEASYMRLTVIKLKEELRTRRLPVSGTKAVLVRRLMDNDAQALRGRRIGELEVTPEEGPRPSTAGVTLPADAPQQSAENGQRECVVPGDGPKVLFDGGLETTVSCSPPAPFVSAKAQLAQRWSEDKASHGAGDPVAEGEEREEGASIGVPEEGGLEEEIRTPSAQDKHIGMEVVTATKLGGELDQKGGTFTSEAKTAIEGGLKVKDGAERAVEDQGDGGSGALESGREQPLFRPVADGSPGEGRGWQEPSQLPQAAATAILRLAEADRHPSICSSELSFVDVAAEQRAELPEDLGNEPPTDPIALGVLAVQFDLCCSPAAQPSNAAPPYAEKTAQDMRQTEMTEAEGPAAQAKDSAGRGQEESAGADGPEPGAGAPLVSADGVSDGGHSNATKGGEDSAGLGQSRADASTGRSEIQEVTEEGDALDSLQGAGQKYHVEPVSGIEPCGAEEVGKPPNIEGARDEAQPVSGPPQEDDGPMEPQDCGSCQGTLHYGLMPLADQDAVLEAELPGNAKVQQAHERAPPAGQEGHGGVLKGPRKWGQHDLCIPAGFQWRVVTQTTGRRGWVRIGRGWWPGPKVHRTAPVGQKAQRHHRCSARADRPLEDTTERHVRDVGRKRKDENLQRAGKAYEPSDMRLKPLKPPGDSQALYPPLDAQKVIRKVRRVMNNESNQEAEPPVFDATQPADTTWTMKDLFHGNLSKEVDDPSERTPRTGDDMQPSHGGGCTELLGRGSGRKRKANILQGFGKAEAHAEEPLPSENLSHKKHRAARSTASPERNHTAHGRMGFPSGVSEPTFPGTRTSHSLSSAAAAAKTRGGTALGSQQAMRPKQQAAEATGCTDPSVVDGNEDEDENAIKRNDPQASAISFGRQRKQAKSIVAGHTRVGLPPKLFVRLLTHKPRRRWFLAMLHGMQQRTAGLHD